MSAPTASAPIASAPIRDAATVLLLRDAAGVDGVSRPETWLLTRVMRMTFASGMAVFPGGRVDPGDATLPWAGRSVEAFAADFGCDSALAHALVGAAVRETFEEAGVLLTTPFAQLADDQPDVEAGRLRFGDLLTEHGLAVDGDQIRPWARWITPESEPARYDTRFFVAALPAGAEAVDLTTESSAAMWMTPADALAAHDRGERAMLPPTITMLKSIVEFATVAELMAAAPGRSLEPVLPVVRRDASGGQQVALPDGSSMPLELP